jgi:protoporphyrinogen oxidase
MSARIAIVGAGPAGLAAAYRLARLKAASVTVLERENTAGGLAGSFVLDGIHCDYGSHRLHPACEPRILDDLKEWLGSDLLARPRHGRIRLRGRWIHFPLRPLDLLLRVPPGFGAGAALDAALKPLRRPAREETFASVLLHSLGPTICRDFYFPYARKIWGLEPEQMSAEQARRRVSGNSAGKILRRMLARDAASKQRSGARFFYYPRQGYGQLWEALRRAAEAYGAQFVFGAAVRSIERGKCGAWRLAWERDGREETLEADHLWSTAPAGAFAAWMRPAADPAVLRAASELEFRSMVLVYLVIEQAQFTEFDAHYFPGEDVAIARLSEPKNYGAAKEPPGHTVLCAELPCSTSSSVWSASESELAALVTDALGRCGLPVRAPVRRIAVKRIARVYPIYRRGWRERFEILDRWIDAIDGLLTFGRQGLFAHDNAHHALAMGYAAAEAMRSDGSFDRERWVAARRVFETHVVED